MKHYYKISFSFTQHPFKQVPPIDSFLKEENSFVFSSDLSEQLVALLSSAGFDGFEETEAGLSAYTDEPGFDKNSFLSIMERFPAVPYEIEFLPEQNWNQEWEAHFSPVYIEDFVMIRAHFHKAPVGILHDILITPKMSFGTGHHATTWMMIKQMMELDIKGKKVLDFGTGTGVLSILAEKMGANEVLAIDNDPWSIENTRENLQANNCTRIKVQELSAIPEYATYDIILANINRNILVSHAHSLIAAISAGGYALLSGFLDEDESTIRQEYEREGQSLFKRVEKEGWVCICFNKHL